MFTEVQNRVGISHQLALLFSSPFSLLLSTHHESVFNFHFSFPRNLRWSRLLVHSSYHFVSCWVELRVSTRIFNFPLVDRIRATKQRCSSESSWLPPIQHFYHVWNPSNKFDSRVSCSLLLLLISLRVFSLFFGTAELLMVERERLTVQHVEEKKESLVRAN